MKKQQQLETGEGDHGKREVKYKQLLEIKSHLKKVEDNIKKGLKAIQKEWYDLNFNYNIKLDNYIDVKPEWEGFK